MPSVDGTRCKGNAECVRVCPYGVFEIRRIGGEDFEALGLLRRVKSMAHSRKTAYTPGAAFCRACSLCVAACPEKAITLARAA